MVSKIAKMEEKLFEDYLSKRKDILQNIQKIKYGDLTFLEEEEKINNEHNSLFNKLRKEGYV